jgi:predicted phage terminase large subunit-like protein
MVTKEDLIRDIPRFYADFDIFVRECLGMQACEEFEFKDLTPTHGELNNFLQHDPHKTKMVLMPRYSFKSTITTIGHILWCLVRNPNERILIYSDSSSKAEGFLAGIKAHIEGKAPNSRFREYFPQWETDPGKAGKWNDSEIIIRPRKVAFPEPSIDTGGIETSKVGRHYDRIYFDDIVSDMNVTTKAQMDKVYDCYQKSLSLLKPSGDVMITGTRWAFGDPYGRIIENTPKLGKFIRAIEKDGVFPFASIGLDADFLVEKKEKQGSYMVSCLYYNNPVSDEDSIFKYENFKFFHPDRVNTEGFSITCTCDPAGEGEDYTAITVVGTDNEMNMYILDLVNAHLKPNQIVQNIIRLSYKWKFRVCGVEDNFYHGLLEKEIKLAMEEERRNKMWTPFSFETFTASAKRGEGKHNRIMALQPYHERGSIVFPCKREDAKIEHLSGVWAELANQMLQYTVNHRPMHDDALDSLAYHIKLLRPGLKNDTEKFPKDSIAAILKRDYDKQVEHLNRLPRKYRPKIQPFFLEVLNG